MLSICIPIYNRDVRPLVRALLVQVARSTTPCEVVCLDDGSEGPSLQINRELMGEVVYVEIGENIGRAAIRNRFVEHAHGEWLLFLDCDAEVSTPHFLERYCEKIRQGCKVVCGGHRYVGLCDREHRLKYRYGTCCEMHSAEERNRFPNRSFMTGNFMINKELLQQCPFDERLNHYGYEDTLMGYRLWQQRVMVEHIDNPIDLRDIDTNRVFLEKTAEGVRNLVAISGWVENPEEWAHHVRLLEGYDKLKKWRLTGLVKGLFKLHRSCLEHRFLRGYCSMLAFKFYKLGLLCLEVK